MQKMIKTRFPPSPTGFLHIGSLRTALYNFLFSKKNSGHFYLRIEDTDQTRKVPGAVENIVETLSLMNLHYDNSKIMYQSERLAIYRKYAEQLLISQNAYLCFCTQERLDNLRHMQQQKKLPSRYDGKCRMLDKTEIKQNLFKNVPYVIRQKIPARKIIAFRDLIHGEIKIQTDILDDQILLKTDGWPTYHLASVVDDHEMGISHIIRGEEWLSSTPKHIMLYECFRWELPEFAHLPLLLNPDKSKLSKRQGDVSVKEYLDKGYLPEAILNFVLLLGWNPGDNKEIFSLEEMVKGFSPDKINKSGAIFNMQKLNWFNSWYIRHKDEKELVTLSIPYLKESGLLPKKLTHENIHYIHKIVHIEKDRIKKLSDLPELVDYFFKKIKYDQSLLLWKNQTVEQAVNNLSQLLDYIDKLDEGKDFTKMNLEKLILQYIKEKKIGIGETLWPFRVSLCGRRNSPGPFEIGEILGKKEIIMRIKYAIKLLTKNNG